MKFSRIIAASMFAMTLLGTVPARADFFDWIGDLFANNEEQQQPAQQAPRAPQQPKRGEAPRGGRHGRRENRRQERRDRRERPAQQAQPQYDEQDFQEDMQYQPRVQRNPYVNPRVRVNQQAQMKKTIVRNVGLVGIGLALAFVVSNTGLLDKIRDILGYTQPINNVNNVLNQFNQTANNVAELLRNLGNNMRNNQGQNNH